MFCTKCGLQLDDEAKFCTRCGAAIQIDPGQQSQVQEPSQRTPARSETQGTRVGSSADSNSGPWVIREKQVTRGRDRRKVFIIISAAVAALVLLIILVFVPMSRRRQARAELEQAQQEFTAVVEEADALPARRDAVLARAEKLLAETTDEMVTNPSALAELRTSYESCMQLSHTITVPIQAAEVDAIRKQKEELLTQIQPVTDSISDLESGIGSVETSIEERKEQVVDEMFEEYINSSSTVTDSLTAFSFGTLESDVSRSGHTIQYQFQYNTDIGAGGDVLKATLSAGVDLVASVFEEEIEQFKEAGVDDAMITITYLDKDGNELYSRTFN